MPGALRPPAPRCASYSQPAPDCAPEPRTQGYAHQDERPEAAAHDVVVRQERAPAQTGHEAPEHELECHGAGEPGRSDPQELRRAGLRSRAHKEPAHDEHESHPAETRHLPRAILAELWLQNDDSDRAIREQDHEKEEPAQGSLRRKRHLPHATLSEIETPRGMGAMPAVTTGTSAGTQFSDLSAKPTRLPMAAPATAPTRETAAGLPL